MVDVLRKLKEGKKVDVPIYNFVTHQRETATKTMYGANVIIFEGILVFHSPEILEMLDMKVFVDTDADIRLARRLKRYGLDFSTRKPTQPLTQQLVLSTTNGNRHLNSTQI